MFHPIRVRLHILAISSAAVLGLTLSSSLVTPVLAQDNQSQLEEVTVTGSRITRRDYVSNSPIVTIEAAQFEQQTGLNIESYLNQLPEYNPAASPVTTQGDVQITPTNSVGIASISLRGFGPNRSLVLVDGRRQVPNNALMVTDVNGIPSSMIQRVETISGGASATYGADAVGGVTNFITRKDFEGFEFDGQYGISEAGDGDESRISMLFGTNFADGRGNITFSAERYERKAAMQKKRDFYKDYWAAKDTAGFFFFAQGQNGYSCNPSCPTNDAYRSLFGGLTPGPFFDAFSPGTSEIATYNDIFFNPDGTIWGSNFPFAASVGQSRIDPATIDGQRYALRTSIDWSQFSGQDTFDALKWNFLDGFASAPQDRYSIFVSGNFEVTDKVSVFARARYADSKTRTVLFGTDAISGWETSVPYDPTTDSPVNPAALVYDAGTLATVAADPAAYFAANPNPGFCGHLATTLPDGVTPCTPGHPVPAELAWLLNSRPQYTFCMAGTAGCGAPGTLTTATTDAALVGTNDPNRGPTARWQPQWFPDTSLPPRQTTNDISTWQIEGGINFELPFRDWTGEAYFSHGESSTYNVAGGNLSLTRYRALANYPDYGAGAVGTGNAFYTVGTTADNAQVVPAVRPYFGVGDFQCTSGFYPVFFGGDQLLDKDCYDAVNAVLQTRTDMALETIEVNLQGGVYDLPAGELRGAIGYQRRDTDGSFNPDILQSEDSFQDQVIGVYPTGYLRANTVVDDFYVEALIPVLSDLPFVQKFEIEAGARYSIYEGSGNADNSYTDVKTDAKEWTYKILANWQVKDWVRLRGGYNRATRAPNLGEMFLNPQEIFTIGGNFGDPCNVRSNAPWGAGGTSLATDLVQTGPDETAPVVAPGQTQAGADRTEQICEALMGQVAANYYYRSGNFDSTTTNATGGGGFNWVLQKGNAALTPEKADTFTAGFVLNSPFDNPWIANATLSFDWYRIDIEDAIMTYSIDYANFRCYGLDTGLDPVAQAATPACQLVPRDTFTGPALNTTLSYDNQATINTSGFDLAFTWFADIADLGLDVPGSLAFNMQATVLDYYKTKQSPAPYDVETDWKGTLGPNLPGTQAGAYDYRLFGSLTYHKDNWSGTLRWRHLPSVYVAGYASQQAVIANDERVAAGGDGIMLGYTPGSNAPAGPFLPVDSYDVFDLSATWDVNETFTLRAGITNLFDKSPPTVGDVAGYPPDTDLAVCNGAPGCSDPTSRSLPTRGSIAGFFTGGYYDTIGRRFFVGLKASF